MPQVAKQGDPVSSAGSEDAQGRRCSGRGVAVSGHSELRRTLGLRAGSAVKTWCLQVGSGG